MDLLQISVNNQPMDTEPRQIPTTSDPLGETLHQLRLKGSLYCRSELTAPWGIQMPVFEGQMMFHIVTSGSCWLQVGDQEPRLLPQGSLALIPHGKGHTIFSDAAASPKALFSIPVEKISDRYELMRHGEGGQLTELTCGVVSFDHIAGQQLISQLPEALVIDSWDAESNVWLQSTLQFIAFEARSLKPGGETIITHLADILVIQAIRAWIDTAPEAAEGWFAALRDKKIGKALTAIHRQPQSDWTIDSLAKEVGMSRSGFSARFTELVGDSAKSYLTKWRMQIARNRLMDNTASISVVAQQLGYASEAAFSRAFKRNFGIPPGKIKIKGVGDN